MSKRKFRLSLLATVCILPFQAPQFAFAQTETPDQPYASNDTIVVTARRREESLQDAPVAVSAFSADLLQDRQIVRTSDLEKITPNLQFKPAGQLSGNAASGVVFIRGVGQLDPLGAVDPGVGVYIDEVYIGRASGATIEFGDLSDVQVLRGPQGTLFGRNTIGGAILVRTKTPEFDEFSGTARFRTGEDDLYEGFAALNIPLSQELAARVSGGVRKRDGYVTRVFDGLDLGHEDVLTLNGALRWQPSSVFEVNIRADYTDRDENGAPFVFADVNESAPVPAIVSVAAGCPGATIPFAPLVPGDPQFGAPNVPNIDDARCANDFQALGNFTNGGTAPVLSTSEVWGASATAEWELSDAITLKSISAYRSTDARGIRDADNTPFVILTTDLTTRSEQFSQELQMQYSRGSIDAILGGYYFNEEIDERANVFLSFPPSPPVIASLLGGGPGTRDLQNSDLSTESFAVFGEAAVALTDALNVSGGVRYTSDTKKYLGNVLNVFPSDAPDPDPLPTLAIPDGGPLFIFPDENKDTFSAITGSANISYRFTDWLNTYFSFARSFKSGGFNNRYNAPPPGFVPISFDEESVNSYELGAKMNFGDVTLNLAAFRAKYTDIQLIFRQGVVPLLFNAGEARLQGFEAELTYQNDSGFRLDASIGTLDDEILSVTPVPGATATIAPGDELPLTPSVQASFGISHEFAVGDKFTLTPRFDGSYTSEVTFITGSIPLIAQEGYFVGDASVRLQNENANWYVTAGVLNAFDEEYLIQGNASLATLGYAERIFARPRNWFVQLGIDF